jgi:hypothetical protein
MTSQEWKGLVGGAVITIGLVLAWTLGPRSQLPYVIIGLSVAVALWIFRKRIGK